jgi:hypothetical protein
MDEKDTFRLIANPQDAGLFLVLLAVVVFFVPEIVRFL